MATTSATMSLTKIERSTRLPIGVKGYRPGGHTFGAVGGGGLSGGGATLIRLDGGKVRTSDARSTDGRQPHYS
jgi:hypothetical protein